MLHSFSSTSNSCCVNFEILISKLELELQCQSFFGKSLLSNYYQYFLNAGYCQEDAFDKTLHRTILEIDRVLSNILNKILHHPRFQLLEASWKGLEYLTNNMISNTGVKIKLLDLSWSVLAKDLCSAIEFDQSTFFKKIYSAEFDQPGGEPFGLLIGDYEVSHLKNASELYHPIEVLKGIAKVATAAFAPFIMSGSATLLELDHYGELQPWMDLPSSFKKENYLLWQNLRDMEEARFLGLTAPKILRRTPYKLTEPNTCGFCFTETIESHTDYLWGSSAYCFAMIVVRSYQLSAWFMDIRGVKRDYLGKGLVTGLVTASYGLDRLDRLHKPVIEWNITKKQTHDLNQLGIMPLTECYHTNYAAFFNLSSLQRPKNYDKNSATMNAKLSTQFAYLLCCSRFAHYVKIMIRDKLGSFSTANEIEHYLQTWVLKYTAMIDNMSQEAKVQYPLREAKITVREQVGSPGSYFCVMHLCLCKELRLKKAA